MKIKMQKSDKTTTAIQVIIGGYSSAGVKGENQDAFAALIPEAALLTNKGASAVIADGLSCADNAAEASQLSVTQFIDSFYATPDTWSVQKSGAKVLTSLNNWLYGQAKINKTSQWLTTLSAIVCKSSTAHIFHVGDCRISRLQNNIFETLTREHNHKVGGKKTVLTRVMGADNRLDVDYKKVPIEKGDMFLLSSDGVFNHLTDKYIKNQLSKLKNNTQTRIHLEQLSKQFVDKAIESGSTDNVTCLIIKIDKTVTDDQQALSHYFENKVIPPPLKVGDKIDNFQVQQVIVHNTRSHIYLVKEQEKDNIKILKAPSLNFSEDKQFLRSFVQEAWIGERIDHANLMKVTFAPEKSQFLYHLSDHIKGQSLRQWMTHNPKPDIYKIQNILKQLIMAVRVLQRMEIVHLDIRPENIIIDDNGHITLIDYGATKIKSFYDGYQNIKHMPMGTLEYSAPEYLIESKADFKSDMFSIAIVVYELLSGKYPYKLIKNQYEINHNLALWQYKTIRNFRCDCPLEIDLAIRQACSPDHTKRYNAFSEFEADICAENIKQIGHYKEIPFMEREPVKFWKLVSLFLFLTLLIVAFK
ncbi:bifunctional protein-serine/threonine kinase/phosphatase [Pseudoalteromonas sp. C2R02]|uniref:protein kinase domain-containing protein n=1 Tax=Pseudoalteromonas sp. C2R02 TaxID=2841565 RepID=UPI001C08D859|nr:bifunctional protein-serine/threonine kinase/phosphatase [Pseudoalteromonas sp. C2R02]